MHVSRELFEERSRESRITKSAHAPQRRRARACGAAGPLAALLALSQGACGAPGGTGDAGGSDAATNDGEAGAGAGDSLTGTFRVELVAATTTAPGYTQVVGKVQSAPTPAAIVWELAQRDGDCELRTPRVPFCSVPCASTAVCSENDTCTPYPTTLTAGTVRIAGLQPAAGASAPLELRSVGGAYQLVGAALAFPSFTEGDTLRIEASGAAALAPFTLETRGIAALELAAGALTLSSTQPLTLRWAAPAQPGARIDVALDISHHGGSRGKIVCSTADDGELVLSSALVARLLALGVAGYPSVVVTRLREASTPVGGGSVRLEVASQVERYVDVPGVRSCTTDAECGSGGTCRADLTCS